MYSEQNNVNALSETISELNQKTKASRSLTANLPRFSDASSTAAPSSDKSSPLPSSPLFVPWISPVHWRNDNDSVYSASPDVLQSPQRYQNTDVSRARVNLSKQLDSLSRQSQMLNDEMFRERYSNQETMAVPTSRNQHYSDRCLLEHQWNTKHNQKKNDNNQQYSNSLNHSFDARSDTSTNSEGNLNLLARDAATLPSAIAVLDMRSKAIDETSEISSVSSSDQMSPPAGSAQLQQRRNNRKSSAPKKVDAAVALLSDHSGDYLPDTDESMYEAVPADDNGVLDMSMKTQQHKSSDVSNREYPILSSALSQEGDASAGSMHKEVTSPVARFRESHALPETGSFTPSSDVKIGDLINSAITRYHGGLNHMSSPMKAGVSPGHPYFPSSPKMKAKMYAKMYVENELNASLSMAKQQPVLKIENVSNSSTPKKDFLSTNTGTYQITTEDVAAGDNNNSLDDTRGGGGAGSQVIKVVKQGNYLKLKKESQVIDGELRFICPHCNKLFHRSSNFSRHMRIHRGVFSYVCSTCSRGFYRKEHYNKHKCYRKSMTTTWARKTKVDLDRRDVGSGSPHEKSGCNDKENSVQLQFQGDNKCDVKENIMAASLDVANENRHKLVSDNDSKYEPISGDEQ